MDLSVLIPARNEMFLRETVNSILASRKGDTEVIVICDGYWPDPSLEDNPHVTMVHHTNPIGQRAATNEAARLAKGKFIMKADAHCAFDEGFDVKLMADCEKDWTVVPRMYNLHAFDWMCRDCGHRVYQGPVPNCCEKCKSENVDREIVWMPRLSRKTDFARFDATLHFQYWGEYGLRPEVVSQGDIADLMCCVGACWFMHRERYWEIGGMDESHGSWGQMGVELACKSWLSGGRQVVNKKTWFSHLFRTQPGFGFPYPNPGVGKAREYSRDLWFGNKWSKAVHPLRWLIDKFSPVRGWENFDWGILQVQVPEKVEAPKPAPSDEAPVVEVVEKKEAEPKLTKAALYYTCNTCEPAIAEASRRRLLSSFRGDEVVAVSLKPIKEFSRNIVVPAERGILTMFKQILIGLEFCTADVVFLCEHDMLYHPEHFDFIPERNDLYYYNENTWKVDSKTGQALFYYCQQTSGLCAHRTLLLEHYRKRVERVEREGFSRNMGFEPGNHRPPRGVDNYKISKWFSTAPNVDIRHGKNLTPSRWSQDKFRNKNSCTGWKMADEVPVWGKTKGRFMDFLKEALAMDFGR